ncbi:MAG: polysaccharide biosynthesis/export family protein [Candidatus Omnitrophota bacterium]
MFRRMTIIAAVAVFFMLQAVYLLAQDEGGLAKSPELGQVSGQTFVAQENTQPEVSRPVSFDPLTYTLGPDDVVQIDVMRHSEFSGVYPIDQEGKLQYKFVGDMDVNGMTKKQLEARIKGAVSVYLNSPEVNVTVLEYRSKFIYVLGEVGAPGKYYMRAESIPIREAVFEAGLPTTAAAMRKCRIITPTAKGKPKIKYVNLYEILYGGDLKRNISMKPGDVLYVPATVMAKIIRIISPGASVVGVAASGPEGAATGKTAAQTLSGRP